MPTDETKLSESVTVGRYRALEKAGDREALAQFVRQRFDERYFRPLEASPCRHGFALMAIGCIVIETLESFYQGRADTRNHSAEMFRNFFNRDTPFKVFRGDDWFFREIRCGILHQAETRKGWRIRRSGALLDSQARTINASRFFRELQSEVQAYSEQLKRDDACWHLFEKKMKAIIRNCP